METYVWPFTNETAVRPTWLRTHPDYESLYTFWSKMIVMEFGPYLTLIVLNTVIVLKIVRASRFRRKFRNNQAQSVTNRTILLNNNNNNNNNNINQGNQETNSDAPKSGRGRCASTKGGRASTSASSRRERFARTSRSSNIHVCRSLSESFIPAQTSGASTSLPKQHEVNLALTLVGISILFIVCQSVKIITDVYELFCEKIEVGKTRVCKSTGFIDMAVSLANLFTCINSAANFLVYMLRGKKFRDVFLNTYCCKANSNNDITFVAANSNFMPMATRNQSVVDRPSVV